MYLHIGNGETVRQQEIVGIFDMDTATVSGVTKKFLSRAEREKHLYYSDSALPRTFLLLQDKKRKTRVLLSHISTQGLLDRSEKPI